MLHIETYTLGRFQVHNYLVWDDQTKEAVLIDTGENPVMALEDLKVNHLELKLVLYTHAHIDHIEGHAVIREAYPDVPTWVHRKENFWIHALPMQAALYGMRIPGKPEIDGYITDGQVFELTNMSFHARFCPGHTPGGISFYVPELKSVFTGDSLFAGSIGRTDFPKGNHEQLLQSIEKQLLTLPDETVVHSGHGITTTIGQEKRSNPYLRTLSQ